MLLKIILIFYFSSQPFGHNASQATILEENIILKATEVHFPAKPTVSDAAKAFTRRCLAYKKDDRMDVHMMVRDPYLCPPQTKQQRAQAAAAAAHYQPSHQYQPPTMNFVGQIYGQNSSDS